MHYVITWAQLQIGRRRYAQRSRPTVPQIHIDTAGDGLGEKAAPEVVLVRLGDRGC